MKRSDCQIGQYVRFGRAQGAKTLGQIIKMNPTKAKIKIVGTRGSGRGSTIGSVWNVPYGMLCLAPIAGARAVPIDKYVEGKLKYSLFQPQSDIYIIQAIASVFSELSPENLTQDGELRGTTLSKKKAALNRKLKGLFEAIGRELTESEVYEWERQRREAFNKEFSGTED